MVRGVHNDAGSPPIERPEHGTSSTLFQVQRHDPDYLWRSEYWFLRSCGSPKVTICMRVVVLLRDSNRCLQRSFRVDYGGQEEPFRDDCLAKT